MSYKQPLWDITSPRFLRDESTNEFRWRETRTEGQTRGASTLRVKVDDTSNFLLFSEALLQVDFEVSATSLTSSEVVALPNAWSLFKSGQIMFNGKQICQNNYLAQISHMMNLQKYSRDYSSSIGDTQMFYPIAKRALQDPVSLACAGKLFVPQLPATQLTPADLVNIGLTGIVADDIVWLPRNDPSAEFQIRHIASVVSGNVVLTATADSNQISIRRNPIYDASFAQSRKRLLGNVVANKSVCSVMLPLKEVFPVLGMAFDRVNRGVRFELELLKNDLIPSVFFAPSNPPGLTFDIVRCSVWVPALFPSLESQTMVESQIATAGSLIEPYEQYDLNAYPVNTMTAEQNIRLAIQKSRVSRIIVAFQLQTQTSDVRLNPLQFDDPGKLGKLELRVNGVQFPMETYNTNSDVGSRQGLVRMLRDVYHSNNKTYDYDNGSLVDFESFVNGSHRVYMLDATFMNQDPFRKQSVSDVELRFTHGEAGVPIIVYTLMVSEAELKTSLLKGQMVQTQT